MHKDIKEVMLSKEQISDLVREIADRINADYAGEELVAVVILKGSIMFAADLIRALNMDVKIDFMQASSYGVGTESAGVIKIKKDMDIDIEGKNVLIIEDIIDSGRTLSLLKAELKKRNAKSVRIAALLSKPSRRVVQVEAEYIGTEIPDKFVVGYGLDVDEKYRWLDYVGVVKPELYM